jgi:hypothetical protein
MKVESMTTMEMSQGLIPGVAAGAAALVATVLIEGY